MNEIIAGQLHANTINTQDAQAVHIKDLEAQLDGMGMILHHVRTDQLAMREKLDEAHRLSVTSGKFPCPDNSILQWSLLKF